MKQTEVTGTFAGERCPPGSLGDRGRRRARAVAGGYSMLTVIERARGNGQSLRETLALASRLLKRHGLAGGRPGSGRRVALDTSARRAGQCSFRARTIYLAVGRCLLAAVDEVRDTILHEIAHAMVGPNHGHDEVWRRTALAIGCKATRCHDSQHAAPRWTGRCGCGRTWQRRQLSLKARTGRCPRCKERISWELNTGGINGGSAEGAARS